MISLIHFYSAVVVTLTSLVSAHICPWDLSIWGFNVTDGLRPQDPLINLTFDEWWFHGHLKYPPHPNDIKQMPVGEKTMFELSCDKDATSYYTSGPGGDQRDPNNPDYPCPGQPITQFHTNGIDDLGGCALAVAYKSDVNDVQPEDFVVFSVNHTCVWNLHTYFEAPADMPPCPNNKCTCAWFWIHKEDSGSEQNYMTGFQCNFANAVSTKKLGVPQVPRRCGPEKNNNFTWNYGNCTYGPKQPFYWYQAERNNMHEGTYTPPLYLDLYNFHDGAQNDIFVNSTGTNDTSPTSKSGSAASDHEAAQPSSGSSGSSSLPPKEIQTPSSDPQSAAPAATPAAHSPKPAMDDGPEHDSAPPAQTEAAKSTAAAGNSIHHHHHHHHHHNGHCTCRHKGKRDVLPSLHPSWEYLRDTKDPRDQGLRNAWLAARRRRSLEN